MAAAHSLRASLERGALVTAANWPIVVTEFLIESLFKMALAVPIVGGALMVGVLLDADVRQLFNGDLQSAADQVARLLANSPAALSAFVGALFIVAIGGALVTFTVKAGTLAVLSKAEQRAPDVPHGPIRMDWLRRAKIFAAADVIAGVSRFGRRIVILGLLLCAAYAVIAAVYVSVIAAMLRAAVESDRPAALAPLVVAIATSAGLVAVTAVNLLHDLWRVIVVRDDCGLRDAWRRLLLFLREDAREIIGLVTVMGLVTLVAEALAFLAAAGLAFVAWVPLVGWIFVPLQAAAWLVRGMLFQHMNLMTIAAYQTYYRRFSEVTAEPAGPRLWVKRA